MAITKTVQALIEFDGNGQTTGKCSIDGKSYSNFPSGVVSGPWTDGKSTTKINLSYMVEIADHGNPITLSAYTISDNRVKGKSSAVSSHT